jgi:hypothetical protein
MRQTGRTTRIVQHVVDQLFSVGTCVATDHVVYEYENPKLSMLGYFKEKVEREIEFRSHGSKGVKTTDLNVNEIPYIKFEIIKINN